MPFLRALRETIPPLKTLYQNLPHTIKRKLILIEDLHDQVWMHDLAQRRGRSIPDFDKYLDQIRGEWEETSRKIASEEGQVMCPSVTDRLGKEIKDYIRLMTNPELELPRTRIFTHFFGMSTGLWHFWLFWPFSLKWLVIDQASGGLSEAMGITPSSFREVEAALDLNLAKLAFQVGIETTNIKHWGKKREGVARRNLEKKFQTEIERGEILNIFSKMKKEYGDSFNKIVGIIHRLRKKEGKTTPGKKTIERILKKNDRLMKDCFQEQERGRSKRIVYIRHTDV